MANNLIARLDDAVQQSAEAVCQRLDVIHDTLKDPFLTPSREFYRRALLEYTKKIYEEALEDLRESVRINKIDYIAWFLLGKVYLFGFSEFSTVIDLDAAIAAFTAAAKYIKPEVKAYEEARLLAAEIWFYLGLAKQTKSNDLFFAKKEHEAPGMMGEALQAFEQSWAYSENILEALYNAARCKALLGDSPGAILYLEKVILKDGAYSIKTAADRDFDCIRDAFYQLMSKMKKDIYPKVQAEWDRIHTLTAEFNKLKSSGETIPPEVKKNI
jgi:tetratricopeptide (TPR) repeat protein